jgi:hypothetical protein
MAISLVVISFVAGIALGQWFRVLILVPAMSTVLIGTIAAGIARADDVWSIALVAIAAVAALSRLGTSSVSGCSRSLLAQGSLAHPAA